MVAKHRDNNIVYRNINICLCSGVWQTIRCGIAWHNQSNNKKMKRKNALFMLALLVIYWLDRIFAYLWWFSIRCSLMYKNDRWIEWPNAESIRVKIVFICRFASGMLIYFCFSCFIRIENVIFNFCGATTKKWCLMFFIAFKQALAIIYTYKFIQLCSKSFIHCHYHIYYA